MVITPQDSYLQQARNWIERLDTAAASGSAASRLYVYRVKHGKAENLAEVLSQAFGGGKEKKQSVGGVAPGLGTSSIGAQAVIGQMGTGMGGGTGTGMGSGTGSGTGSGLGQGGLSDSQGLAGGSGSGGVSVQARTFELDSEEVSVVADVMNNSILVRASPRNYKKILDALKQLDIVPLQVLVQASIIEVTLGGDLQYGISWNFLANLGDSGYKSDFSLNGLTNDKYTGQTSTTTDTTTGTVAGTVAAAATAGTNLLHRDFPGFNWTIVANPSRLVATLSALAQQTKVNVLSSPSVMVLDNQEAKILVGQEVPVQTQAQQSTVANSNIINSYQYRQAGVSLEVKPRVTPGGMVQMAILQKVDNVKGELTDRPTFTNRQVKSAVAVRSNQAVVLGGLIQDKLDESKSGVPGLYELPFLGPLFGKTGKVAERTELIVILIPKVVASDQDVESVSQDFRNRLRGVEMKF